MNPAPFSIVMLPFLKTSAPTWIGRYLFRSTTDLEDVPDDRAQAVREVAAMLYAQNDEHPASSCFALVEAIDLDRPGLSLQGLGRLRAVIAYVYGSPTGLHEGVFLRPEDASLVYFTPGRFTVHLISRDPAAAAARNPALTPDARGEVAGYSGHFNLHSPFWVVPGSRLYPPTPHVVQNLSQDLNFDFGQRYADQPFHDLLLRLLGSPETPTSTRFLTAIDWYNAANEISAPPDRALLNLAVAFETLLKLPQDEKTGRLVDSISLLLGRTERLDDWAQQFYRARSRIAHEGRAGDLAYYPGAGAKSPGSEVFGSLMLYGRRIFRLCFATLLVGADLAEGANLRDHFVSNKERFEAIRRALDDDTLGAKGRLAAIKKDVEALAHFRFVAAAPVSTELMLSTTRLAAGLLVDTCEIVDAPLADALAAMAGAQAKGETLAALEPLHQLHRQFEGRPLAAPDSAERIVHDLQERVWGELYVRYFQLQKTSRAKDRNPEASV